MGTTNGKPELREEDVQALMRTSNKTEAQVRDSFNRFLEDHPTGEIDQEGFKDLMKEALPAKDATALSTHMFKIYDTDGNGTIDFKEFMTLYFMMSEGSPEEILSGIFRMFDDNGDGSITTDEMKKVVKSMYSLLKTDNPGLVADDCVASSAFSECDKNGDGKVTREEFIHACLNQEDFTKILAIAVIDVFNEEQ